MPARVQHRRCETCEFWDEDSQCRARAPVRASWPQTSPSDWCGDWKLAGVPGELEAIAKALADYEEDGHGTSYERYTDSGRQLLLAHAEMFASLLRRHGATVIILPRPDL